MRILFEGDVHVGYGQIYVESQGHRNDDPFTGAFKGQDNGLCGVAIPGHVCVVTGDDLAVRGVHVRSGMEPGTREDHYQIDPRPAAAPALFAAVEAGRSMTVGAGAACEAAELNV